VDGLRFIVLLVKATLRLFVSCVIMEQMLRHAMFMDQGHYIIAAYLGRISVVKELIEERNADVNARFFGGTTALGWARNHSQPEMTAYLISHCGI